MTETLQVPVWVAIIIGLFALWALLNRLLLPSVRWYFQRRANVIIDELNMRLDLELPAFKLTTRRVLIDRLTYDQKVLDAVEAYCHETGALREVAIRKVKHYAREIVPDFSAYVSFRFGNMLAKRFVRTLYRIRLGFADTASLENLDAKSSVVFVMNHRSNMDYILVAYLALNKMAISYAVGEWARVWPIQQIIRSLGGYFVRRGSNDALYRRVLERYVQMAIEGGVVQAIFPEGGLSRDGYLRPPKLGLLDYMLRGFDPDQERDIVFIPVGINYDRVLEDRTLLLDQRNDKSHRTGSEAVRTTLRFMWKNIRQMMRGDWYRFGYACANFGAPVSLREFASSRNIEPRKLDKEARGHHVQALAEILMQHVGRVIPVLPVSLTSHVLLKNSDKGMSRLEIKASVQECMKKLENTGARIYVPRSDRDYAVEVGLRMLLLRRIVAEDEQGLLHINPDDRALLEYYRNAIAHLLPAEEL
ncbi:MAG: 1-acyl-sn-glycerol-3-phosphate acyltransferase [Gammaproteobacteria bacterium]